MGSYTSPPTPDPAPPIRRLTVGFEVEDDGSPGTFYKEDGSLWLRNADGTEVELGSGNGGSSPVLSATKHITSAQVLTLNSAPGIVIAPGIANTVLIPLSIAIVYRFGTIDYTSANGFGINWESFPGNVNDPYSASDPFPVCSNPGIDALYVAAARATGGQGVVGGSDITGFVGAGLILFSYNADPTGGDGTLDVTTTYLKVAA